MVKGGTKLSTITKAGAYTGAKKADEYHWYTAKESIQKGNYIPM